MCQRRKEMKTKIKYKNFQNASMRHCTSSENLIYCCCFFFLTKWFIGFLTFQQRWTLDLSYKVCSQNQKKKKVKVLFFVRLLIDRCVNSAISVLVDTPYLKGTSLFTPLILNVEYLFLRQCNSLGHKILLHQRSQINEYKMNIR